MINKQLKFDGKIPIVLKLLHSQGITQNFLVSRSSFKAVPRSIETLGEAILNLSGQIDLPITLETSHYLFNIGALMTLFSLILADY